MTSCSIIKKPQIARLYGSKLSVGYGMVTNTTLQRRLISGKEGSNTHSLLQQTSTQTVSTLRYFCSHQSGRLPPFLAIHDAKSRFLRSSRRIHSTNDNSSGLHSAYPSLGNAPFVGQSPVGHTPRPLWTIREITTDDFWPVADMHCDAFYPRSGLFWGSLFRFDRVVALQIGKERGSPKNHDITGESCCLIAESVELREDNINTQDQKRSLGFLVDTLVKLTLPGYMQRNYALQHSHAGILGAVVIDTFLDFVPPKRKMVRGGIVREFRRDKMAYLSNLAVSQQAQRSGLGSILVRRAEEVAKAWGCTSVTLHVDPTNTPAVNLYRKAGYRCVGKQPEWQRIFEGRQTPLLLMLRRL